jgi:ribosomal protein L16 Arg81 hydroxylase
LANALDISDLSLFCSEKWLGNPQMDAMSAVLNDHLTASQIQASVHSNNFFQKLLMTYRFTRDSYPTEPSTLFLRKIADILKSGIVLVACTAVAVRLTQHGSILLEGQQTPGNHWCALVIDVKQHTLHYGDPMGSPPPPELVSVMNWWLGLSFLERFSVQELPIT